MGGWRFLDTGARDGATNMAIDEALLRALAADAAPPTLRVYGWAPACLSLGRFQRYEIEVDAAACAAEGVDVVRRPTGGRLILHEHELTYSLVAREDDPRVAGPVMASYARISAALRAGLARLGLDVALAGRAERGGPARTRFGACFDTPSDYELVVDGRKLVGSAQWRHAGVLLQHGSILLRADAQRLYRFARPPRGWTRAAAAAHLAARVVGIDEVLGRAVAPAEVATALRLGFAEAFGLDLHDGALTAAEHAMAERLRAAKYASLAWTRGRTAPDEV